ncbi:glycosyltransferase family protein [Kinneretia aquatilis]|uniref:UDP-glycosyltransferase n=1 Tax=Kinneretia aquatilis TaxID=2070761 RepID=UPI001495417D|nr:UDP-glycosyltransferase [Paucibacter aquatile]WIV97432.1 UDP-glycosyltransferase [Paucibacter aquatile]
MNLNSTYQPTPDSTFLIAYGGGHVAMLAPVAKALLAAQKPFVFLALTTAGEYLERQGIPHIAYRQLPGAQDADVLELGERLAADLPAGGSVPHAETVAYLGLNYRDLIRRLGIEGAGAAYQQRGRQAFLPQALFEDVFAQWRPALVVATNSPRSEQAALLAAGRMGIPSVCAVDIFGLQEVQWIGQAGYARRVCVLNESVRQMFLSHGRRPEEVVVTGNPAFDRLTAPASLLAGQQLRQARGWNDGRICLLWASQIEPERHPFAERVGDPSLPRRIESYLREFVALHEQFRLVVRYHPSERVEFEGGSANVEFSPCGEDLGALLHAVDAVVVTASTVGLEASLAGRPVFSVDCSVFTADAPYSEMGVSTGVAELPQLGAALLALKPPAASAVAGAGASAVAPAQESAAARLLNVMNSLLN